MSDFPKTVSGKAVVSADAASGTTLTLASYPKGTTRADWAAVDVATAQVSVGDQNVFKGSQIVLAIGASMQITNNSGATWRAGQILTISGKAPVLALTGMKQAEYDALPAKDANTVYVTSS